LLRIAALGSFLLLAVIVRLHLDLRPSPIGNRRRKVRYRGNEVDDALAIAEQAVYLFLVTPLCNLINRGIAMTAGTTSRNTPDRMDLPVGREPFHPMLVPFAIACFAGAFVTDLVYWQSLDVMWETFSDWLLTAGMIIAGLAIIAFVIDVVGGKQIRTLTWPHAVGYVLAVLLSLINAFVHSRDGYTAVVPTGLTLSALVVVILLFTAWVSRRRVGAGT
jgi:uncharacterized membrane protein